MDLVRQKQAEVEARTTAGEVNWFQFKEDGIYQLRILPPHGEKRQFWMEYQKSFNVGPNKKIVVPLAQFGQECPLSKRVDALNKAGDELSKKEAGKLRPKSRVAMIVIDRKNEATGPCIFETNLDVFRDVLTIMSDPDFGDITNPDKGTDIQISYKKEGRTGFPEWTVQPKRNSSPLSANPQQQAAWLTEDWFDKFRVGKPSEAGYVQACLDGTETAFIEARKSQNQQNQQNQQAQQSAPAATQPATAGYAAPAAPPSAAAPAATPVVPAVPVVTHKFLAGTKLWHVVNGQVAETTVEKVCERLKTEKPESVMLLAHDQAGGWMNSTAMGFVVAVPQPVLAAPPPPAGPPTSPPVAPPSMPAMPPPPGGGEIPFKTPPSEEAALAAQLAGFGAASPGPVSNVAKDIAAALGR